MEDAKKFVDELLKKEYKDKIYAVGLLPAPKEDPMFSKFYEENIPEDIKEKFKESFERKHIIYILSDFDIEDPIKKVEFKAKVEKDAIEIVKNNNLNLWIDTFLLSEINQMASESHFEIFDVISRSDPVYDPKGYIEVIKLAVTHRNLVLQKFDRYVVCYVLAGSYIRGTATAKSDVDAYVVIDDTDVKRHTPWELKQKLLAIITGLIFEAQGITGSKKNLHVQVYTLTEFWKSLKDVNPVITTFLRDGIPIYDKGLFVPWKLLLVRGEIKPSEEAVETYLKDSENLLSKIKNDLRNLFINGIYWSIITSFQAVVMEKGMIPPAPKEAVKVARDLFVIKEPLLEEEYIKILEEAIKLYKDFEHGEVKEFSGKDIDDWISKAEKFINRMKRLRIQIENKKFKEDARKIIDEIEMLVSDLIKVTGKCFEKGKELESLEILVKEGKIPESLYLSYKEFLELKKDYEEEKMDESKLERLRTLAREIIPTLSRYIEKYLTEKVIKRKIGLKVGEKIYDLYLFDNNIIIKGEKIYDLYIKEGKVEKIEEIDKEEFDKRMKEYKTLRPATINKEIENKIKELIGEFELIF